jgi:hypothetical protein
MLTKEDIESFLNRLSAEGPSYSEGRARAVGRPAQRRAGFQRRRALLAAGRAASREGHDLPSNADAAATLSRRLLELNATDMVHGSYGIEQDSIVMTEALELSHLDYEEFLAAFESITVSLASHLRELGTYREAR